MVVAILAGTAWTVGAFVDSSAASARATAAPAAVAADLVPETGVECVDCDEHTLAPLPSWQTSARWHPSAFTPDGFLRAAGTDRPEGARESRPGAGTPDAPWLRVSAPAESDVSG